MNNTFKTDENNNANEAVNSRCFADHGRYTISVREFCWRVGIGKTKAYSLIKAGEVDVCRIGGRTLVKISSINSMIERSTDRRTSR